MVIRGGAIAGHGTQTPARPQLLTYGDDGRNRGSRLGSPPHKTWQLRPGPQSVSVTVISYRATSPYGPTRERTVDRPLAPWTWPRQGWSISHLHVPEGGRCFTGRDRL